MPVIKVFHSDEGTVKRVGETIQGLINTAMGKELAKTAIGIPVILYQFMDGGEEVIYVEIISGKEIFPPKQVDHFCGMITQTQGLLICLKPQYVWALSGKGKLE